MSTFELIEFQFDPDDFSLTLEDEFLITKLSKEIEAASDKESLRQGCLKLLHLAVQRQAVIRSLIKRLTNLEGNVISTLYKE